MQKRLFVLASMAAAAVVWAVACTSMLVSAGASGTGRPLLWKHRDTGAPGNFLERVDGRGKYGYVGLFNNGDSLHSEAWMGMNDAGFAVMNTASYNVRPYAGSKDGEGLVMSMALANCSTIDEFEALLASLCDGSVQNPGMMANFGAMDAQGGLAYFEADDYGYVRTDVPEGGWLIRTNFSVSGTCGQGMGRVRYCAAERLLEPLAASGEITPLSFINGASHSFWQAEEKTDYAVNGSSWVPIEHDFIPRGISTASIVVEGVNPGDSISDMAMWAVLGYPPVAEMNFVSLDAVPDDVRPVLPGWEAPASARAAEALRPIVRKDTATGKKMVNMEKLRPMMEAVRQLNSARYHRYHKL